jgi:hypothetical protein
MAIGQRGDEEFGNPAVAEDFEPIEDLGFSIGADGSPFAGFHHLT